MNESVNRNTVRFLAEQSKLNGTHFSSGTARAKWYCSIKLMKNHLACATPLRVGQLPIAHVQFQSLERLEKVPDIDLAEIRMERSYRFCGL